MIKKNKIDKIIYTYDIVTPKLSEGGYCLLQVQEQTVGILKNQFTKKVRRVPE